MAKSRLRNQKMHQKIEMYVKVILFVTLCTILLGFLMSTPQPPAAEGFDAPPPRPEVDPMEIAIIAAYKKATASTAPPSVALLNEYKAQIRTNSVDIADVDAFVHKLVMGEDDAELDAAIDSAADGVLQYRSRAESTRMPPQIQRVQQMVKSAVRSAQAVVPDAPQPPQRPPSDSAAIKEQLMQMRESLGNLIRRVTPELESAPAPQGLESFVARF